ncbi:PfaB family protein [Nostoc sp. PCC 7524]|uniref:PfaB family protein n=1 Tax=Nostoc sp. (strain ATCC 29411 / PCC 7524) TaxID=28072 RepID=UPI00029F4A98|nr:type I polyketide synthase [Nostoc sp. PCC 7524]AFY46197.1 PfaB family protein [Nostoc sp. PCC 7524]
MQDFTQNKIPKIAIVGMDCYLGGNCKDLDTFERSIYEGRQHFTSVPPDKSPDKLPQENQLAINTPPLGAYIQDCEIDTLGLQIPPEEVDNFHFHELLMLKVADQALKDADLPQGIRIAVVITTSKDLAQGQFTTTTKGSAYPIYLENKIADQIAKLWNFAGPTFTLTAEQNSVFKALEIAQKLLHLKEVDAVLVGAVELAEGNSSVLHQNHNTGVNTLSYDQNVNGWMVGEGAAAVVLKLHETAKQDHSRIYAVIDALSLIEDAKSKIYSIPPIPNGEAVTQACQQAFRLANIQPTDINYLEVVGSGIPQQDESEIQGLLQAYQTGELSLSCAIGSVKANIGHTYGASGIVSLMKTALCLYHRYIPAVPQWSSPKMPEVWQGSPFYVATESKPWFLETEDTRRTAAINGIEIDGSYAHVILSEEVSQTNYSSRYLEQMPYYMFAIAADDRATLLEQIHTLEQTIEDCSSLSDAARLTFIAYQQRQQSTYALAILGRNKQELTREIQRAIQGVATAFETGKDWQTPVGSYFSPKPLGEQSQVSFVYPGSFSSYIGLARDLFRLFPEIYDDLVIKSVYNRVANIEKLIYPRSLPKLSKKQLEVLERQLIDDPVTMLEFEIAIAGLLTGILRNYFQLQPQSVFGYSLGENSMMFAQGIWNEFNQSSQGINTSSLFKTRLSGPKNAVREHWDLPLMPDDYQDKTFWSNYVVLCPISRIQEAIQQEKRVYLTLINTPEEAVIAGETEACQRVIKALNCHAQEAPINHVIHCEPMHSEYNELVKMNSLPVQNVPNTIFYSAAEYAPITLNSQSIGHNLAKTLCQQLDFPKLINRVYNDGCQIFMEVGIGSNCSRWIGETLKQKAHLAVSLHRRGMDFHTSILRALAKLFSHRVSLDLSPLYGLSQVIYDQCQLPINLDDSKAGNTFLESKNQPITEHKFSNLLMNAAPQQQQELLISKNTEQVNFAVGQNTMNTLQTNLTLNLAAEDIQDQSHVQNSSQSLGLLVYERDFEQDDHTQPNDFLQTVGEDDIHSVNYGWNTHNFDDKKSLPNLRSPYYQKLKENVESMTKAHATFLHNRQESLQQISNIVQQQLALSQKLLELEVKQLSN